MIEQIAMNWAIRLNKYTQNPNINVDYVRYRIAEFLHVTIIIIGSLLVGLITGHFVASIMAVTSLGVLRVHSGGFHLKTLEGCEAFTIAMVTIAILTPTYNTKYILTGLALALVICFNQRRDLKSRYIAPLLIVGNFILQSEVVAVSFLIQALSLLVPVKNGGGNYDENTCKRC